LGTHGKIKSDNAKGLLTHLFSTNQVAVNLKIKELNEMKKEVMTWAREAVKAIVLKEARHQKATYNGDVVRKFTHIGAAYALDSSISMQQKIYEVFYGYFRQHLGWAKEEESRYMTSVNMVYKRNEEGLEDKKGLKYL